MGEKTESAVSRIHQVYWTNRPSGSPVPRQDGEEHPLAGGYAVRASSLQGEDLRGWCQHAEPEIYYQLPRDVPAEARARLDASKTPQRMVFSPYEDGHDVLALVSHRRAEAEGSPDSSFAHVLINDPQDRPTWWSNLACLELWGAPRWVREDSAEIPAELESLSDLSEMLGGRPPLVNRDLVVKFLTAPAGEDWHERRRSFRAAGRRCGPSSGANCSPSRSAGFWPPGANSSWWSSRALRHYGSTASFACCPTSPCLPGWGSRPTSRRSAPCAPLAATCFAHPATTDLARRLYAAPRFAMNTYRKRCSRAFVGDRLYAQFIVDRLLRYGWPAVERFLVRLQVGGAKTLEDLETMTTRLAGRKARESGRQGCFRASSPGQGRGSQPLLQQRKRPAGLPLPRRLGVETQSTTWSNLLKVSVGCEEFPSGADCHRGYQRIGCRTRDPFAAASIVDLCRLNVVCLTREDDGEGRHRRPQSVELRFSAYPGKQLLKDDSRHG